jgi:hypothetical protein
MVPDDDRWANPVGTAFKRYENGAEHSVRYFYKVFCETPA